MFLRGSYRATAIFDMIIALDSRAAYNEKRLRGSYRAAEIMNRTCTECPAQHILRSVSARELPRNRNFDMISAQGPAQHTIKCLFAEATVRKLPSKLRCKDNIYSKRLI